jgi:hypothetical protein
MPFKPIPLNDGNKAGALLANRSSSADLSVMG